MKYLKIYEDFNWEFDEDETSHEINDPYKLKFPIDLIVNDKLKLYIKKNNWPSEMNNLIGKTLQAKNIININYRDLDNGKLKSRPTYFIRTITTWFIPFECMELP